MKQFLTVGEAANALLRSGGQNPEYPYLTTDAWRRISAHEVSVGDVDAITLSPEERQDRLRAREREYYRRSVAAISG